MAVARFWKVRSLATDKLSQPSFVAIGPNTGRPGGAIGNCASWISVKVRLSMLSSIEQSIDCPSPVRSR